MSVRIEHGDCLEVMQRLIDDGVQVDSCVVDPPYHLSSIVKRFGAKDAAPAKVGATGAYARASAGFMGQEWDGGDIAFCAETWALVLQLLKPGGHLVAFSGTRTYHRMAVAIEDAGFEIRDQLGWLYGTGFPKSHNVGKAIDRTVGVTGEAIQTGDAVRRMRPGADQEKDETWEKLDNGRVHVPHEYAPASPEAQRWSGWGTALKPAWEPVVLARKPLVGTVAENILKHGTGAINVDGCRVASDEGAHRENETSQNRRYVQSGSTNFAAAPGPRGGSPKGRFPANVIHDGSDEVLAEFPANSSVTGKRSTISRNAPVSGTAWLPDNHASCEYPGEGGSPSRFFYSAKADKQDRCGSKHPTVKPIDLMAYLCRLVTPPGGTVLDPFAGSGTTGMACLRESFDAILIEKQAEYVADIHRRLEHVSGADTPLFKDAAQ